MPKAIKQNICRFRVSTGTKAGLIYGFYLQGINVHLAKKMIEDRSRDYMNARRVAKVRNQIPTE